jgi:hypothetical protein
VSEEYITSIFRAEDGTSVKASGEQSLVSSSALNMEATCSPEIWLTFNKLDSIIPKKIDHFLASFAETFM